MVATKKECFLILLILFLVVYVTKTASNMCVLAKEIFGDTHSEPMW